MSYLCMNEKIRRQMKAVPAPVALDFLLKRIDDVVMMMFGIHLTVTGYIEARAGRSYHPIGRALDVRLHGLPPSVRLAVIGVARALALTMNSASYLMKKGERIDVSDHWEAFGTDNEHLHVELDDGKPAPAGAIPIWKE